MTKDKGITLIALIITIITMLILTLVTINIVLDGGLLKKAQESSFKTELSAYKEEFNSYIVTQKIPLIENFDDGRSSSEDEKKTSPDNPVKKGEADRKEKKPDDKKKKDKPKETKKK